MVLPHLVLGSKENATLSFGFGFKMFRNIAKLFSQFEFHQGNLQAWKERNYVGLSIWFTCSLPWVDPALGKRTAQRTPKCSAEEYTLQNCPILGHAIAAPYQQDLILGQQSVDRQGHRMIRQHGTGGQFYVARALLCSLVYRCL